MTIISCANCKYLIKTPQKINKYEDIRGEHIAELYGCRLYGTVCGWCLKQSELNTMGCSGFQEKESDTNKYEEVKPF